jgi:hypothetical protein
MGKFVGAFYGPGMRRVMVRSSFVIALGLVACTRINPAFDDLDELGYESETGDGDPGDGDGDSTTGDGDGDTSTTGDGDGDTSTTGDGDGDPSTTGDGDGDTSTTGDGDGDTSTTGDGDGDDPALCSEPIDVDPYVAVLVGGVISLDVIPAPGFAQQEPDCQTLTVCNAEQPGCGPQTPYLARINSGGVSMPGVTLNQSAALQIHFSPGKPSCGMPPLVLGAGQYVKIHATNNNNNPTVVEALLPCFQGTELQLWVGNDGSTFYDAGLSQPAALW